MRINKRTEKDPPTHSDLHGRPPPALSGFRSGVVDKGRLFVDERLVRASASGLKARADHAVLTGVGLDAPSGLRLTIKHAWFLFQVKCVFFLPFIHCARAPWHGARMQRSTHNRGTAGIHPNTLLGPMGQL